ncbi:hypothetical protein ACP70R_001515 [Stipagrostis hirtigluma subsp. patula]
MAVVRRACLSCRTQRRGLEITVAVSPSNAPLLAPLVEAWPEVGTVTLPFPSTPATPLLPAGCGKNTKDLPRYLFRPFMASLAALRAPLLDWRKAQSSRRRATAVVSDFFMGWTQPLAALRAPLLDWCKAQSSRRRVTAVVSDFFTGWTQPLAAELGVPHVMFSPSCALHLAMSRSLWSHVLRRRCAYDADETATLPEIPGLRGDPPFLPVEPGQRVLRRQLLRGARGRVRGAPAPRPDGEASARRGPAVRCRGLLSRPWRETRHAVGNVEARLDAFADGSVMYVSFGTQHALSPAQAACVANALALSSAAFVWAVRSGTAVPEGFEAATASRGSVIRGWAPQLEILRYRTVGWFLTHCGWNSMLDAAAAGVAMLTWPMGADQFKTRGCSRRPAWPCWWRRASTPCQTPDGWRARSPLRSGRREAASGSMRWSSAGRRLRWWRWAGARTGTWMSWCKCSLRPPDSCRAVQCWCALSI